MNTTTTTTTTITITITITDRELGTILAALRCFQQAIENCGGDIPDDLHGIATNGDQCELMQLDEIDALCERINCVTTSSDNPGPDPNLPSPRNGDRCRNLRPEMDSDEDGGERITPAGNEWVVHLAGTPNRWLGCKSTGAVICPDAAQLREGFERLGCEGVQASGGPAEAETILSIDVTDLVDEYTDPDKVAEWGWIECNGSFAHRCNGQAPGVNDFILNLARAFDDVPAKLAPAIAAAREAQVSYVLFHQGC